MKYRKLLLWGLSLFFFSFARADLNSDLLDLQHAWAKANYETSEAEQEGAFEKLTVRARQLIDRYPDRAEPRVWLAIVLASDAGINGGISALSKVKEAKKNLEQAEQIDASVLNGSVYTSLGSLYYQVPGWPLGFGDDDKARVYLQKALAVNPDGIDPNYFYGDFLLEEGEIEQAIEYLEKAQKAPPREGRPLADRGRRKEVAEKLAAARRKL